MKSFTKPLEELAEFEELLKKRRSEPGMFLVTGCVPSQKSHMMYALGDGCPFTVIVCPSEEKAAVVLEEFKALTDRVGYYPPKDLLFYQADLHGNLFARRRIEALKMMLEKADGEPLVIVTTFDAGMDRVVPLSEFAGAVFKVESGSEFAQDELVKKLANGGYSRESQAESPGQFAVRGGIVDVFPLTQEMPVRIEFWGDEIDSIRSFDAQTQRSIENLMEFTIYPAEELESSEGVSFFDYFNPDYTLFMLDEPARLIERGETVEDEIAAANANRMAAEETAKTMIRQSEIRFFSAEETARRLDTFPCIGFSALEGRNKIYTIKKTFPILSRNVNPYNNSFELLTMDLKKLKRKGYRVVLLSGSVTRAKRLAEDLRDYDLSSYYDDNLEREVKPGEILVANGYAENGYEYPMLKFTVISEKDIFGTKKPRKKHKKYDGHRIRNFTDLKPGDYVVHENHGLGIYQGIEKIEVDHIIKDYIKITYADGGNLYILATQLDLIQKYASSDAKKPQLNRLGGQEWSRTKTRVKKAVEEIASDLVELYAVRRDKEGYAFEPDTVWQKEFEEMFPFEETEDQLLAIEATKKDMESRKIMDRLICGDVGFGKTEIALRAAFKAVQENKQVAYLVPTTILAQQHYNTFVQRMRDFPVRVDLLSRFRTAGEIRQTLSDLKKGQVDILIGTHRLLSEDVKFKDLGLLVIDEEQRFGVRHKEKIKQLKNNVDVLTLTATPIPRTLHMSLIGIRDMTVLEEPPMDRMPIQTYVMEYQEEMVREAIVRELSRQGQVYYVFNRVQGIEEMAMRIRQLVPEAVVEYAHGQMHEHHLEQIMLDFISGEIDVLVSTTIIETGLDIPNANTIIIHDADRMGLSQLYQLRGRVGRSNRLAYAFLLYRRDKLLKEVAEKRLTSIREFTDLGSGVKIAMRDLEIRGAGNLLGEAQSGNIGAVGYDLYCKMLNDAVKCLKDEEHAMVFGTTIELNIDAYIPTTYIANEYQKLDLYKRIADIETEEEREDMLEELIDRYGEPPKKVQQLLMIAHLKNMAHQAYITGVEQKEEEFRFEMHENARVDVSKIPILMEKHKNALIFKPKPSPVFIYRVLKKNTLKKDEQVLELVQFVIEEIASLKIQ